MQRTWDLHGKTFFLENTSENCTHGLVKSSSEGGLYKFDYIFLDYEQGK